MRTKSGTKPNEMAGALWIWSVCILWPVTALMVLQLLGGYSPGGPSTALALLLALVLGGMPVVVAWALDLREDIRTAWGHLWKYAAAMLGIMVASVLLGGLAGGFGPSTILWWFFLSLALVVLGERNARLRDISRVVARLAAGDLEASVDTSQMRGELVVLGDHLNQVKDVVATAVDERSEALLESLRAEEERSRAERMRTELIANVSHDLRTPLTSVISYADLLTREIGLGPEERDDERLSEYAEVLGRQSVRLKRLIDDLIDASKAQTGSVPVTLEAMDARVLVSQAAGEWEERLKEAQVTPVVTLPDEPVGVVADGRHMGRVLDNLLGNVAKYAQPTTRVYLSLERAADVAVVTCRNISAAQLNVTAEELLERFVRGDASRTTEGSGLGLSIAQSLMELMGGRLHLTVDGDLFKVELSLPLGDAQGESAPGTPVAVPEGDVPAPERAEEVTPAPEGHAAVPEGRVPAPKGRASAA